MTNEPSMEKHVLIVEDEPDFAALLRSILTQAGYTVATAYNCEDALNVVRKHRPDVITLDIHMPRKSGALFYRKLMSDASFREIPVVVVTGLTLDKEMGTIIRSLMETDRIPHPAAYVEKPVDGACLLSTIEDVLSPAVPG